MNLFGIVALGSILSLAATHGGVTNYVFNGTPYQGFVPYTSPSGQSTIQREWDSYDPITDPGSSFMRCNKNGAASKLSASIPSGSTVSAYWKQWTHDLGPVLVWMAKCPGDCVNFDGSGPSWFKIQQTGLVSGTLSSGTWGMKQLMNNNNTWTTTIPSSLVPGNYLLRHELLAIHTSNSPQWYPECAQITVTGNGKSSPSSAYLASIPGVWKLSDPSVNINVYSNENQGVTTYKIPGPDVWTG